MLILMTLMTTSCITSLNDIFLTLEEIDICATGTIEFFTFNERVFVDLEECWQTSYLDGEENYNYLRIECELFTIVSEFETEPSAPKTNHFPMKIHWDYEKIEEFTPRVKGRCSSVGDWLFDFNGSEVTVKPFRKKAPYVYHLTAQNDCALYNVKIHVLSEPTGKSYSEPDKP